MSIRIPITKLSDSQKKKILRTLSFEYSTAKQKNAKKKWVHSYHIDEQSNVIHLPYNYGIQEGMSPLGRSEYPKWNAHTRFEGELREYQKEVKQQAVSILKRQGSCVLSLHVGWGKSVFAIYLAHKLGFKTLIIVNRLMLAKQWKELIGKMCVRDSNEDTVVQFVTSKDELNSECDFYIMNATNVPKMGSEFFVSIGTLICDEVHLICAATLFKAMFYIYPRYSIALSATPTRPDGLDKLIEFYFGSEQIVKPLMREHRVYPVFTGYTVPFKYNWEGRIDWNSLLCSQAEHKERNEMICDIICAYPERCFLVLCKRIAQGTVLYEELKRRDESVENLLGSKKTFDPEARILIATIQKCGVGFSHDKLDSLLVASDMEEYFIQYLGRVFRTPTTHPYIFDLVDANSVLKKHFNTRKKVYQEVGGIVENIRDIDVFLSSKSR